MISSKYEWQEIAPVNQTDELAKLQAALGLPMIVIRLLYARGLTTKKAMEAFLTPNAEAINDPFLLHDMELVIDRINDALINGEHITIYGDYDTDGITSTALMYETLMMLDANVDYYVPNRFEDGYGPNQTVYERLIDDGTQLIITVDNGVSGRDAIAYAKERGVDVIITDHHELPTQLPDAFAIIHPQHPQGNYPFKNLSGVGVAFKVATALLEEIPQEMLDLVALGEIADLVPLTDENRVLVTYGLKMLAQTSRPGLQALMEIASVNPKTITSTEVAFNITPRLNAIGRLQSADLGVDLLVTQDVNQAQTLAQKVDLLNTQRKQIVADILVEVTQQLATFDLKQHATIVLAGNGWHEGVLGIVASRVVELTQRPTIILSNENGKLKGSARSSRDFNLYAALAPHKELFISFGGHAGAAGLSVQADKLDALQAAFDNAVDEQNFDITQKESLPVIENVGFDEINEQLYAALEMLEPFGNSNPQPYFRFTGKVSDIKQIGAEKTHLKFNLDNNNIKLPVLAFGYGELGNGLLMDKSTVNIVATLNQNTWQGATNIQLMLKDLAQSGLAIIDQRTNKLRPEMFQQDGQYLFFNSKIKQQLAAYLTPNSVAIDLSLAEPIMENKVTFLVDLPQSVIALETLQNHQYEALHVMFYTKNHLYLEKTPTKEEFGKLYKYCLTNSNIPIRATLEEMTKQLHLSKNQLTLMISVFFELGFVKIENGVLNSIPNPTRAELSTAPSYQTWLNKQEVEKKLIYSKTSELITLLENVIK